MKNNNCYFIAGPNGSGKSTLAEEILLSQSLVFLNPDKMLPQGEQLAIKAGRVFLKRLHGVIDENRSFYAETTLSGQYLKKFFHLLKEREYRIELDFIFVHPPELLIERIKERVRKGGHFVPDNDVIRRYYRGCKNFWFVYRLLVNRWRILDNTDFSYKLIAAGDRNELFINKEDKFQILKEIANGKDNQ